jgi:chromosome segregation ATPase
MMVFYQESERRGRQKEIEINRLKSKLTKVAEKEKETSTRNKAILAELAATHGLPTSPPSVHAASPPHSNSRQPKSDEILRKNAVAWQSNRGKSPAPITRHAHSSNNSSFSSSGSSISVDAAVEAFAYDRKIQQSRIAELETQVRSLERSVADAQNLVVKSEKHSLDQKEGSLHAAEESAGERSPAIASTSNEMTPTARSMFEKINVQAEAILRLTQQLDAAQRDSAEKDKEIELCRSRCSELKEGWENMKLEIESRPTARLGLAV